MFRAIASLVYTLWTTAVGEHTGSTFQATKIHLPRMFNLFLARYAGTSDTGVVNRPHVAPDGRPSSRHACLLAQVDRLKRSGRFLCGHFPYRVVDADHAL
jgi:hypothetical protein